MFTFGLQTFVCVFSDVLIEIFVLHRYFSQYLSLYEVFNVQPAVIYPTALTEFLSVIRNLIFMKPLIAHKISF